MVVRGIKIYFRIFVIGECFVLNKKIFNLNNNLKCFDFVIMFCMDNTVVLVEDLHPFCPILFYTE